MEFTISKAHEWIASHEDGSEVTIPSIFLFESDPVCFQLMAHAAQNKRMKVTFEQEGLVFDARNGACLMAENMAWLLRCIEAGRAAGVKEPAYEKRIATNYIR